MLSSESQERMCAVVAPENVEKFAAVCRRWDVLATVIGEVTDGEHLVIDWHGQTVVDVPPRTVAHRGPVYERPLERPEWQDDVIADTSASLNRPSTPDELRATTLAMISSPALCSRAFITEQYDRYVRGNTVLAEHADSGMIRIDEETGLRDRAGHRCLGSIHLPRSVPRCVQLALAEAYRNVSVSGAAPVAVTNCLNFGSPENPAVMGSSARPCAGWPTDARSWASR